MWNDDTFDYANENSAQLQQKDGWKFAKNEDSIEINVLQGKAIVYWDNANSQIKWKCDKNNPSIADNEISFRHDECLIVLPLIDTSLKVTQGQAVIVQPKKDVNVRVFQGKLRIAENGAGYKYDINNKGKYGSLQSHQDSTVMIKVRVESGGSVERYSYND